MRSLIIALFLVYTAVAADPPKIKCLSNTKIGENTTIVACPNITGTDKPETQCYGPSFDILTGIANYTYGCGACPTDKDGNPDPKCAVCTGNATNNATCNKVVAGPDFSCYNFAYDSDKKVFAIQKADPITCHSLNGTKAHCNSPGKNATSAYTSNNKGCGQCAANLQPGNCTVCDGDRCNSATSVTALLLPLAALLYSLF